MDSTVLAIIIFFLFSLFVPASMLLTSITLRKPTVKNPVRDSPYESGEQSRGFGVSLMHEYLHYFGMFIALEVVAVMILAWVPVSHGFGLVPGLAVLGLFAIGLVFEGFMIMLVRKQE